MRRAQCGPQRQAKAWRVQWPESGQSREERLRGMPRALSAGMQGRDCGPGHPGQLPRRPSGSSSRAAGGHADPHEAWARGHPHEG